MLGSGGVPGPNINYGNFLYHPLGMEHLVKALSCFCQAQGPLAAVHQLDPQLILQLPQIQGKSPLFVYFTSSLGYHDSSSISIQAK